VLVQHAGKGKVAVLPLFVAITEDMVIEFEDVVEAMEARVEVRNAPSRKPHI
jgi:hypothetical protein